MLSTLWSDLVHASRSLTKARAFTLVCVISLGIGMAPVIGVFYASRVMDSLMAPTAVRTDGLVEVFTATSGPREAANNWSYADFMDLRRAASGVEIVGWTHGETRHTIQTPDGPRTQTISASFVSANYFQTLGMTLARGQGFDATIDDPLRTSPVVILGYDLWQNRLGADPNIVGKSLTLDDVSHVVVGVAPSQFTGHLAFEGRQIFLPLERHPLLRDRNADAAKVRSDRNQEWIHVHGRLAPNVTVDQATAAVSTVTSQLAKEFPATNALKVGTVAAYDPMGVLERPELTLLRTIAVTLTGMVLLVVCLNISGMMLVRNAMRERELSVRQAIGANRRRLVQNLLAEATILAAAGGALAAIVLFNLPALVAWLSGGPIPAEIRQALGFDVYMFGVCLVACLVTSLMCGWLPAMRFSRPAIISSLKDDAGVGGTRAGRVHRVTAALQVAIAVPLIVMAGIALERIRATAMNDLGFDAEAIYAAPMGLEELDRDTADFRIRAVQESLSGVSGIDALTVADGLPLDFRNRSIRVALPAMGDVAPAFVAAHVTRVGADYLKTMGIPLVRGRGFTTDDRAGSAMVTVISATLASELFPDTDPATAIGSSLVVGDDEQAETLTIVGVTADFPTSQMSTERAQLLLPMAQHAAPNVFLVARAAPGEPAEKLTAALERVTRDLDPDASRALATSDGLPYSAIVTGAQLRENSVRDFISWSIASGSSGGVILILSGLGIYGVVGLMVATRTREIAVRVALGASRRRVVSMILFDVVKLVTPGIGVGVILAVALLRLNSQNMGISLTAVENGAYVFGAAVAIFVAVLASLAPARRAASVQPMIAMRSQ